MSPVNLRIHVHLLVHAGIGNELIRNPKRRAKSPATRERKLEVHTP